MVCYTVVNGKAPTTGGNGDGNIGVFCTFTEAKGYVEQALGEYAMDFDVEYITRQTFTYDVCKSAYVPRDEYRDDPDEWWQMVEFLS